MVKTELRDGIAIIYWENISLMGDPTSIALKDEVRDVLDKGLKRIIIDFSQLKKSNSAGLGILLSGWNMAFKNNAELVVVICSDRVSNIFNVTKLTTIIKTFKSVDEALDFFNV